jgi:hypothetical protein
MLITTAVRKDLEIPGYRFTVGTLELAQGLGDFASLDEQPPDPARHLAAADARLVRQVANTLLRPIALQ